MNNILLDILAFGAMLSGILVITAKNPVISVLFLISVFVNAAGYLVLIGVGFIGISYLIVYVGAIAILFLFVIMMLNLRLVELIEVGQEYTKNLPLGAVVGSLFLFELLSITPISYPLRFIEEGGLETGSFSLPLGLFNWINSMLTGIGASLHNSSIIGGNVHITFNPVVADNSFTSFLQIESIGQGLYTYGSLWLIISSVILLLAMVGPITLCLRAPAN